MALVANSLVSRSPSLCLPAGEGLRLYADMEALGELHVISRHRRVVALRLKPGEISVLATGARSRNTCDTPIVGVDKLILWP